MKTHFLPCTKTLIALLYLCVFSRPSIAEWQPHQLKQADGRGGWITQPAQIQSLKHHGGKGTMPFGMVQMGNGEIAFIGAWHNGTK